MEWEKAIKEAIRYIEGHITEDIMIAAVADEKYFYHSFVSP